MERGHHLPTLGTMPLSPSSQSNLVSDRAPSFRPSSPEIRIRLRQDTFYLNRRDVVSKSAKLARLLEPRRGHPPPTSCAIPDAPADVKTFQTVALFFLGRDPMLSPDNTIPVACLADYLGMTEDHSPGNLLHRSLSFLSSHVLPHWTPTVRALSSSLSVLDHAARLGLVGACLDSLSCMAAADPSLLDDPPTDDDHPAVVNVGVKRRLFDPAAEDLTCLHPRLYVQAMRAVAHAGAPDSHIARCLHRYARRWARVGARGPAEAEPVSQRAQQKEVIEAIEKLLPEAKGVIHVKCLLEMLRRAVALAASQECLRRLELRVARQLAEASARDLFVERRQGYAVEAAGHDVECARRIVAGFLGEAHGREEVQAVAEAVEGYLAEAAGDAGMGKEAFVGLAGMLAAAEGEVGRRTDGVYRAVDAYLVAHAHMTQAEREEVCRVLDVRGLSREACEHAARNERLPIRVVTQVLLMEQLRIREVIASVLDEVVEGEGEEEEEEEEEEKEKEVVVVVREEEEEEEEEAAVVERCERCSGGGGEGVKRRRRRKKGLGFWREMVRWNFGCMEGGANAMDQCRCHLKKVNRNKNK